MVTESQSTPGAGRLLSALGGSLNATRLLTSSSSESRRTREVYLLY